MTRRAKLIRTSKRGARISPAKRPKEAGHVYAQVGLWGTSGQRRVRAMVDTGATLTVLPPRIAEEIGVPRLPMTLKLELADRRQIAAEAGPVILSCRGIQVPATVVIVPRAKPLLGAQALKSLGLTVSARTGKLRRVRKARITPDRQDGSI